MKNIEIARNNFLNHEKYLSQYACLDSEAVRLYSDDDDIRSNLVLPWN